MTVKTTKLSIKPVLEVDVTIQVKERLEVGTVYMDENGFHWLCTSHFLGISFLKNALKHVDKYAPPTKFMELFSSSANETTI